MCCLHEFTESMALPLIKKLTSYGNPIGSENGQCASDAIFIYNELKILYKYILIPFLC